jgi:hypothetical protein
MRLPLFAPAALLLGMTACAHVPPASLWSLKDFDPLTADPAQLRAAVVLPVAIMPKPGGVKFDIVHERKNGAERRELSIALEAIPNSAEGLGRLPTPRAGSAIHVFRIPPADIGRVTAFRAGILEHRVTEPDAWRGSVSISAAGCAGGPLPSGPLVVDTYLKTEKTPDFVPLVQGFDLRSVADPKVLDAMATAPCAP